MPQQIKKTVIFAGYTCNNNCIFCSEADEYLEHLKEKSLLEVKKRAANLSKS